METVNLIHLLCGIQPIQMISKNKIKKIRSLSQKKIREREQLFLIEGDKIVPEVLDSAIHVQEVFTTGSFRLANEKSMKRAEKVTEATEQEIKEASLLKQPQHCLAVCVLPLPAGLPPALTGLSLYLDGIQDPGNLGTIIRICDWFGLEYLFCSPDTADVFNPKVIQSSMGSFCRVKTEYAPFPEVLTLAHTSGVPVLGTSVEGNNIYTEKLPRQALVVLGNEGKGIRPEVAENIGRKLKIPSFNPVGKGAESLNVAVATAIICSEFRRQANHCQPIQNESRG
jgi:RNA methyltransferase, TrmH family